MRIKSGYFCSTNQIKQNENEKSIFTIITAVMCCFTVFATDSNESGKTSIYIKELIGSNVEVGRERDLFISVSAVLDHTDNIIEIELNDVGSGDIYIVDSNNRVVDSVPVISGTTDVIMPAPAIDGYYVLVVSCSYFYGEGNFTMN